MGFTRLTCRSITNLLVPWALDPLRQRFVIPQRTRLEQRTAQSARTLRNLLGPIRLELVTPDIGRPSYRAVTTLDALALIEEPPPADAEGGSRGGRGRKNSNAAGVPVEAAIIDHAQLPIYMRVADKAGHLRELGMSDRAIARALGVSDKTVAKAAGEELSAPRLSNQKGIQSIERVPSAYPAKTPRRSAGSDARTPTGRNPAGGDVGSATAPRAELPPPLPYRPDEGHDTAARANDRRPTEPNRGGGLTD